MSSPVEFNDPFDCRIPMNYISLDSHEKIEEYAHFFVWKHEKFLLSRGVNLEDEIKRLINDFSANLDKIQIEYECILFNSQDSHYGVLSLSARWNSILMWSHYADFHKGYCVGFWEEKMRDSKLFGKGGPVTYDPQNVYPFISPFTQDINEKGFMETHTKSFEWEYEKEYRLFCLMYPQVPTIEDRIKVVPDDFFAEIIIGILTPEKDREEIISIAKEKNIKVFQAKKVPFKFELFREQVI